ncbi:MAG TPA: hypothetical protein VGL58_07350 [Caulobacteraceae bacterium]|jgi:hypothetical protein
MAVVRSGWNWLVADGHRCRPGEGIAYCHIGVRETPGGPTAAFLRERRDLQAVIATPVGGVVRHRPASGGLLDRLEFFLWNPDTAIADIEVAGDAQGDVVARVSIAAGLRIAELAGDNTGLQSGWHARNRAWVDAPGAWGTLLCAGTCEAAGVIKGARGGCLELMQAVAGPAHVVYWDDAPLALTARSLLEAAERDADANAAIGADLAGVIGPAANPTDWMFGAALLTQLQASPLSERCEVTADGGVAHTAAPDALLLSIANEGRQRLRHRQLGYQIYMHAFRVDDAGPATRAWLRDAFEPVKVTLEAVRDDYLALIRQARVARPGATILIMNALSSDASEDLPNFVGLDAPLGELVSSVGRKEANLMLHDLAREADIDIVDVDLIAAGLGARDHLPDTVHGSAAMHDEVRAEVLRLLRARSVPGFAPSAFS